MSVIEKKGIEMQKISGGAGGYFASPGSHPPKAGAFAPRKTVAKPSEPNTLSNQ